MLKKIIYHLTYCDFRNDFQKIFRKFSRLLKFVQKIPDWELKHVIIEKKILNFWISGQFRRLKNGKITIKF